MPQEQMKQQVHIHWFRNDLRLHDNLAFQDLDEGIALLPVYILDPALFKDRKLGFSLMGAHRMRFLLESLDDLRASLQKLDSDLLILEGSHAEVLGRLNVQFDVVKVTAQKEHSLYEENEEKAVSKIFGNKLKLHEGLSLYHPQDIPFSIDQIPYVFTEFRKRCEKYGKLREPLASPQWLPDLPFEVEGWSFPELADYFPKAQKPSQTAIPFKGGETAALKRLDEYFFQSRNLAKYKETRNGLIGKDYSSKFSIWLANGSISPRKIYAEIKRFEREVKKNSSTYWLYFELMWRDFFRFTAMRYGRQFFYKTGITKTSVRYRNRMADFENWCNGTTGEPFVDANMRELKETGFMSNRGRQNVASYLTKDLSVDWRWGAYWFQHQLIDFDVCSNWGNWLYVAGVGNDPRKDRYFNVQKQADRYDGEGKYQDMWLKDQPVKG